jgi:Phage tail tube protein, TTP
MWRSDKELNMATVRKWANVAVAMQSTLATADTLTAITKANPGVGSAAAHGFVNSDYIVLSVQGMHQLNGKVVRVANVTAGTFELEGVDTTLYETFSSGTAQVITFGTSITTATTMAAAGGDFDFIDTTTIHVNTKTQIPGLANPQTYTFDNLWDIADAGQIAMKAASDQQAQRAFRFTFGTGGPIMVFTGYVGFTAAPTGNAQDKVTSPAVITAFGTPTYYTA